MDVTDVGSARQRPVGLAELVRIPLRRWRTVLATAALMLLTVAGYLQLVPAAYTATTVVVVRPVVTDPFSLPAGGADRAVNMTAESGIATSNDVVDKVASVTGRDRTQVRDALQVETPVGGQLMRFTYRGQSEPEAIGGANGAAEAYLALRKGMYEDQRASVLRSYDDTIAQINAQRATTQRELPSQSTSNPSPRTSALLDQLRALNDQLAQLNEQRSKIASADLSPGAVTSAARGPVPSSRDSAPLILLAGLLGGLLVGSLLAFVRESVDRRIRSAAEAADLIGAPLLGTVHHGGRGEPHEADMRYLALALGQWADRPQPPPLVLLSSHSDEGRTQVSAGLAAALAEAGHEVRLGASPECQAQIRPLLLAAQRRVPAVPPPQPRQPDPVPAPVKTTPAVEDTMVITPVRRTEPQPDGKPAASPEDTMVITPVRKPRPSPHPEPKNGGVYRSAAPTSPPTPHGPAATAPVTATPAPAPTGGTPTPGDILDPALVRIGSGTVRLTDLDAATGRGLVLLDAPAAARDDRGVRVARGGHLVLVTARDRTRTGQLGRLMERLRAAGVAPVGFVLTGDGRD